jgi:hypothetical protein
MLLRSTTIGEKSVTLTFRPRRHLVSSPDMAELPLVAVHILLLTIADKPSLHLKVGS